MQPADQPPLELETAPAPQPPPLPPPPVADLPYPGFLQALLLFLILFAAQIVAVLPFAISKFSKNSKDLALHPLVLGLATFAGSWAVVAVAKSTTGRIKDLFAWIALPSGVLTWSCMLTAGHLFSGILLLLWIDRRFPGQMPKIDYGFSQSQWITVLLLVVVAPLCEEAVFRGVFLRGFAARYGAWRGIALSALFFAVAHGSLIRIPYTFLLGCITGWLRIRSGSLWPGIVAHAFNNGIVAVAMLASSLAKQKEKSTPPFQWGEIVIFLAGLALAYFAILRLRAIFHEHYQREALCDQSPALPSLQPPPSTF